VAGNALLGFRREYAGKAKIKLVSFLETPAHRGWRVFCGLYKTRQLE
jgi:hypothetical protein